MRHRTGSKSGAASKKRNGHEGIRTGLRAGAIAEALIDNLHYLQAKLPQHATRNDWYMALAYTVRDRMLQRYVKTLEAITGAKTSAKVVAYLSAEFLTGPHLGNSLINLGIRQATQEAVSEVGLDLFDLLEQEEEPGLGNGGLGRLAACYMDSLATLNIPAIGYGIRYEFGIFDQAIREGWQVELTDKWLRFGNPWEIVRPEITFDVKFGGRTEYYSDKQGHYRMRWVPDEGVKGIAYDTPVPGYRPDRPQTCCVCGRRRPPNRSISKRSMSAITTARWIRRSHRKPSPRCSTQMTSPKWESNCGWRSSISSFPARCRT